jgi:DNA invertase Pin-like site-specific DNA recombinase
MNYWWDTHAYQQSNKISPPSTTLGVGDDRIYVDHGLTGTNLDRPGLRLALAACRTGDTLVVTKLDRQARSLPAARDILDELTRRNVKLSLGGSIHDPTDPVGRLLFNVLAMVAEFRIRPDPTTHPGRNEGSQGQRSAARQATKAQAEPGQTPAGAARLSELHPSRTRRTVRRRAINDLPHDRQNAASTRRTRAAVRPHPAAVPEHPNQHSAKISVERLMRPSIDNGAHAESRTWPATTIPAAPTRPQDARKRSV